MGVPWVLLMGFSLSLSLSLSLSFSASLSRRMRLCSGVAEADADADADAEMEFDLKLLRRPSLRFGGVAGGFREDRVAIEEEDLGREFVVVGRGGRGGGEDVSCGDGDREGRRGIGGGDELVCVSKG